MQIWNFLCIFLWFWLVEDFWLFFPSPWIVCSARSSSCPVAVHYGKELLQISHRFNVPQLSLGASGRTRHSAQNQHLLFCCSAAVLPGAVPSMLGSEAVPALVPITVRFLKTGFWLIRGRKWSGRKSIYNSIVAQHRSSFRRWTRANGFHQLCNISDISLFTEITNLISIFPVIAD